MNDGNGYFSALRLSPSRFFFLLLPVCSAFVLGRSDILVQSEWVSIGVVSILDADTIGSVSCAFLRRYIVRYVSFIGFASVSPSVCYEWDAMSFSSLRPRSVGSTKTLPPFEAIVLLFLLLSSPFLLLYSYFYFLFAREICYRQVSNTGRHRDAAMLLRQLWKSNVRPYIAICTILFSGSPPPLSYAQFA